MRADLLRLQRDTDSGRLAVQQEIPSEPEMIAGPIKRNKKAFIGLMLSACLIAAAALVWFWRSEQHLPKLTEVAVTQNRFNAPVLDAAISPNGNLLAYADTSGLNLKVISSGEVHTLFTPEAARIVRIAWFPDSSNLIFTSVSPQSSQHQLWSGSIFGGLPRLLRTDADDASISADGSELIFTAGARNSVGRST